jgi:hypothetical protein
MTAHDSFLEIALTDWASAAQDAAFDGRCFCLLSTGRVLNRANMPEHVGHRNPYETPRLETVTHASHFIALDAQS